MSLQNINNVQNPVDLSYLADEYIVLSLANLGLRLGVKGDSLAYKYFLFYDLFSEDYSKKYNSDEYIGCIKYDKNKDQKIECKLYFVRIEDLDYKYIDSEDFIFNKNLFNKSISFDIPVNNIEKYKEGSILINENGFFNNALYGKIIGANNKNDNIEVIVNKFNNITNELELAIRVYYLYTDLLSKYYVMTVLSKHAKSEIDKNNNKYDYLFKYYLFNLNTITDPGIKQNFENIFSFSEDISLNLFNFCNQYGKNNINFDIDKLFYYENDYNCTLFGFIKNYAVNELLYKNNSIEPLKLNYDSTNEYYLSVINLNTELLNQYIDILGKDNIGLYNRIDFLNNDIIYNYLNLLKYYSSSIFGVTKYKTFRRILTSIYEKIYGYSENNTFKEMYIPLDKKINYICNSNDNLQIYYSNDIYLILSDLTILLNSEKKKILSTKDSIICNYDNGKNSDKVKVYNFSFNYNTKFLNYINDISVNEVYTLPFINNNNKWEINNSSTEISALGKNAGNPNIIIIYNDKDKDKNEIRHNILSASKINFIENSEWEEKTFNVNPNTGIVKSDLNNLLNEIQVLCKIPKISKTNLDLFEGSLIISLCNFNCIQNLENNENNEKIFSKNSLSIFSSLWALNNDLNYTEDNFILFDYIRDPNDNDKKYALDLSFLLNVENTVKNTIDNISSNIVPEFKLLLLKTNENQNYQDESNSYIKNKIVLKNKKSSLYKEDLKNIFNSENIHDDYKNDLNFSIQYSDNIIPPDNANNEYIINLENKYITTLSNINVSNNLYPKYDINVKVNKNVKISYSKNIVEKKVPYFTLVSYNSILNNNIDNELKHETIISYREKTILVEEPKITYTYSYSYTNLAYLTNDYYNEYIFSDNVPTIDFKEVLNRNVNVLNRVNILSLCEFNNTNKDNKDVKNVTYNSYIGTSFNDDDKSTLIIGSSNNNINIGIDTLLSYTETLSFHIQDKLRVDFDKQIFNSKLLLTNSIPWAKNEILIAENKINLFSLNTKLIGKLNDNDKFTGTENLSKIIDITTNANIYENKLFYKLNVNSNTYVLINLNYLFSEYIGMPLNTDFYKYLNHKEKQDNVYISCINNLVFKNEIYNNGNSQYFILLNDHKTICDNSDGSKLISSSYNFDISIYELGNSNDKNLYIDIVENTNNKLDKTIKFKKN